MPFRYTIICLLFSAVLSAQGRVRLRDAQNHATSLSKIAEGRLVVVVMLAATCPISQGQSAEIDSLVRLFPEVCVIGVLTKWENAATCDTFGQQFRPKYHLVRDPRGKLTHRLGATITPEAFVLAPNLRDIVYQGALNDNYVSLGNRRREVTSHYLRDAIAAALRHEKPNPAKTTPIGCLID